MHVIAWSHVCNLNLLKYFGFQIPLFTEQIYTFSLDIWHSSSAILFQGQYFLEKNGFWQKENTKITH